MAVPGHVDASRIQTAQVTIPTDQGDLSGYLALPDVGERHPSVIVIHEIFGLSPHIEDVARRFAGAGFVALAPDLYSRFEDVPPPTEIPAVIQLHMSIPDARTVADLDAAAEFLRAREDTTDRVGVVGFCSGGRSALLFATSSDGPDAAIDCWGGYIHQAGPDQDTTPERPNRVMDLVPNLACPLLAVGGAEDTNPSPELLEDLRGRLEGLDHPADVQVFDGAGHAFFNDQRDTYRDGPAHDLWERMVGFFAMHLGAHS